MNDELAVAHLPLHPPPPSVDKVEVPGARGRLPPALHSHEGPGVETFVGQVGGSRGQNVTASAGGRHEQSLHLSPHWVLDVDNGLHLLHGVNVTLLTREFYGDNILLPDVVFINIFCFFPKCILVLRVINILRILI